MALKAIKKSDIVIVLVGKYTYRAKGVLAEIDMARKEGIKVVQLAQKNAKKYRNVPDAGQRYRWTWENLKNLLSYV